MATDSGIQSAGFMSHTCKHGNLLTTEGSVIECLSCSREARAQLAGEQGFQSGQMNVPNYPQGLSGIAGQTVQSMPLTAAQHIAEAASHIRQAQEILSKVK